VTVYYNGTLNTEGNMASHRTMRDSQLVGVDREQDQPDTEQVLPTEKELIERKVQMCWDIANTVKLLGCNEDQMFSRNISGAMTISNVRFQTYVKLLDMVLR
jgi:hypothetical protein